MMHKYSRFILPITLFIFCAGCDGDSRSNPGDNSSDNDTSQTNEDSTTTQEDSGQTTTDTTVGDSDSPADPKCAVPEKKTCNALCGTGCEPGEACLFIENSWLCATEGTVANGGECNGSSECKKGVCATGTDGIPRCIAPCLDDQDCGTDSVCTLSVQGAEPFKFCTQKAAACTPLVSGQCPDGQSCYLANNATQCLQIGEKGIGDSCVSPNECADGLSCLNVAGVSACVRMCSTKGSDTGTEIACDTMCGVGKFQQVQKDTKTGYCTDDITIPTCDPVAQDCDAGKGCYQTSDGWLCLPVGTKEAGEACTTPNDCAKGTFCLAGTKCKVICTPPNDADKCESFDTPCVATQGGAGYCDQ
ncbi:MAG: hypothetical protein HUU55_07485 [Myxococcales bacterium]|nr:hypothetical protein [Myxococcales bacterium]